MNTGVEIEKINVRWDKNQDFLNNVQSCVDGTDIVDINESLDNSLAGKIDWTVTHTNIYCSTLKSSQKIAHDVIVQAAVQLVGTSCTEH